MLKLSRITIYLSIPIPAVFLWLVISFVATPVEASRAIERNSGTTSTKRLALVIGNSEYTNSPLKNPVNDAQDIAGALRKNGFKVTLLKNAKRREMEKAIRTFGKKLRSSNVGLFYFAGHGMQQNGRNYLLPVDANIESESDLSFEAVDAGRVLGKMEDAENDVNIVILDACRNNPFARSFRAIQRGLAQMDAPTGSIVAYATSPGSVAADGTGRNGVYTKYLLKYISQPNIPIEQVFKRVRQSVVQETGNKQTPWELSSLTGNFSFAGGSVSPVPVTVVTTPTTTPFNAEDEFWQAVKNSTDKNDFQSYLDTYPNGRFAAVAKFKQRKFEPNVEKARMTIRPTPSDAKIRIRNIKPRYRDGIELAAGTYSVEVSKEGYKTRITKVTLASGDNKAFDIELTAIQTGPIAGQPFTDPTTGMEFVYVKGGCYQMGDIFNDGANAFGEGGADEKPVHEVCVDSFWMGKYEVTQSQYQKIIGSNPSKFKKGSNYPVETVSWDDAQGFIRQLNSRGNKTFRLPTEAEWEYAARSGGKSQKYSGGNLVDSVAWYKSNSGSKTHRVGTKSPNGLGLYDMSGNVLEWCSDWYGENYYSSSSKKNPQGASSGSNRVVRGGSWAYSQRDVRAAIRSLIAPGGRIYILGFRLVLSEGSN